MRFILTVIGILFFGVASALNALLGVDTGIFLVISLIPAAIGVIISLISGDGIKGRLIEVGIHVGIWVVGYLLIQFFVTMIIIVAVLLLIDHFLLGGAIRTLIWDKVAGAQSDGSVMWPHFVYDDVNNQYALVKTYGECADYYCEKLGYKVSVSASDVGEKTMSTMYGTLHW